MVETALGDRIRPPDWPRETDGSSRKRENRSKSGLSYHSLGLARFSLQESYIPKTELFCNSGKLSQDF